MPSTGTTVSHEEKSCWQNSLRFMSNVKSQNIEAETGKAGGSLNNKFFKQHLNHWHLIRLK